MSARLDEATVRLLNDAANELDIFWGDDYEVWGTRAAIEHNLARILRWVADAETAGPVLHESAIAIARAIVGGES